MEIKKIRDFRKTLRKFERLIHIQLKDCCSGVSLAQCHVLLEIEEQGQATTGQLAEQLGLDKSTLSRTIDGLVSIGLIERLPNPSDRRFTPLIVKEKGKDICKRINSAADDYYNKVFDRIPEGKHKVIIDNFAQLVKAFSDYEDQQKAGIRCCASIDN